MIVPMVNLN